MRLLALPLFAILALSAPAANSNAADTIAGTVRNETTGHPSVGDEVILLRLGEGMEVEGRTKTDARGAFVLKERAADAKHVVRVTHQSVNYDNVVSASSMQVSVYNAVPRIPALSGRLGIAQVESDGAKLKVTEMYAIDNTSRPPVSQFGPRNFDIPLPEMADLDSVEAKAPGGVWVNISPVPVNGRQGLYAIDFPLRPGETLVKFKYHLPYQGPTTFHLKLPYPIQSFAVMHPPSMSFKALHPEAFKSPGLVKGLRLEAANEPLSREVPVFEVSGAGTVPPKNAPATSGPPDLSAPASATANNPGAQPSGNSQTMSNRSNKEAWVILGGIFALLGTSSFVIWRMRRNVATQQPTKARSQEFTQALKEELFQLESERMRGTISPEEYAATKETLTRTLQRAAKSSL